jgi:Contractile injection system tube protein
MPPPKEPFKLAKLKIEAYSSGKRRASDLVGTFVAMFNPASFSRAYEIKYGKGQGHNSEGKKLDYAYSIPSQLKLKLLLDGTGVEATGGQKVSGRVKKFLNLTFRMNGKIHEPNYLVAKWGDLNFSCRLQSVEITYTNFDRDGTALRAELLISLISDIEVFKRTREEDKSSPDLTHRRTVRVGDTLPLLAKEIYGSSADYLRVAQANGLDDFRNLIPGQELVFPAVQSDGGVQSEPNLLGI